MFVQAAIYSKIVADLDALEELLIDLFLDAFHSPPMEITVLTPVTHNNTLVHMNQADTVNHSVREVIAGFSVVFNRLMLSASETGGDRTSH